jgi:hypothetical protein
VQTFLLVVLALWLLLFLISYVYDWLSPSTEILFQPLDIVVTTLKADGKTLASVMSAKLQHLKETQAAADSRAVAAERAKAAARAAADAENNVAHQPLDGVLADATLQAAAEAKATTDAETESVRPSGYGFLDFPSIVVPGAVQARASGLAQQLENLHLKVQDVDVNSVVKVLREIFRPPETQFTGTLRELPDAVEISCQLLYGKRIKASWRSLRAKQAGKEEQVIDTLLDDIIFQFLYDLPRLEALKPWRVGANADKLAPAGLDQSNSAAPYRFPNWQAMEALVSGLESLTLYQHALDHSFLVRAQEQLQRLQVVAPEYALGLYFYGIALTEDRKEVEAAELFRQVASLPQVDESIGFYARLQEAGARLRRYDPEEAEVAGRLLTKLISDITERLPTAPADMRQNYEQLLALADAQLGYTYGTLIVLTSHSYPTADGEVTTAQTLHDLAEEELQEAESIVDKHPEWESSHANEVRFRILNARGYSLFRYAQRPGLDPADFRDECELAIATLTQARHKRPNHYEVLQNLAMIYDDERYDPEGNYLSLAEGLYKQTVLFVPQDYYQYERLARIAFRRMTAPAQPDEQARSHAQAGLKYLDQALQLRPQSHEDQWLRAAFAGALWITERGDEAALKGASTAFLSALDASLTFEAGRYLLPELKYCDTALQRLIASPGKQDPKLLEPRQQKLASKLGKLQPAS